ncbi:MAG TPA: adenylosuccinate lyase [Actinobacteria bacterium]|nr:adenylosuccinate lyase [Actinomycetota bacterium]
MIERYSRPKMAAIWELQNKYSTWLKIEVLALEAWHKLGKIPKESLDEIKKKAAFDVDRTLEIEKEVRHDVIAFLTNVAENVGDASGYLHYGLTSSDVVDTAQAVLMKQALESIIKDTKNLAALLKKKAKQYKSTMMAGRTHGMHAEPTTFGLKLAVWYFEILRNIERLEDALESISYGKLSGAVGTYANTPPEIEEYVTDKLGLKQAEASTQVLQRDRHAQYMSALAILASSIEKFAVEIRHMQRTEVNEVSEPFAKGQKGSSAMPHKKNPIISERLTGLARVVRANVIPALEDVALWHERDISHSSVERVIVPDSTILTDYMLAKFIEVIEGLEVNEEQMQKNMDISGGKLFSQRLLLTLVEKGVIREEAYKSVQRNALKADKDGSNFKENVLAAADITKHIPAKDIEKLFDYGYYLRRADKIFERLE